MSGVAVLLGISLHELFHLVGDTWDANNLPQEWKHLGRQRASEARAHCDSAHPVDTVNYWAVQQWGTRVSLTHDTDAAELWLTTDDADIAIRLAGEASE
jgi:hypothetical protein